MVILKPGGNFSWCTVNLCPGKSSSPLIWDFLWFARLGFFVYNKVAIKAKLLSTNAAQTDLRWA